MKISALLRLVLFQPLLANCVRNYSPDTPMVIVADVCGKNSKDLSQAYRARDGSAGAFAACCSHKRNSKTGMSSSAWRTRNGKPCSGVISLKKAEAFCSASDARLCNITELPLACSTGCGYDYGLSWTSTPTRGCTDYPLSETECERQLRTSDKCALRRAGKLTDGHCSRTCGLCVNHVDDWAVAKCAKDCDQARNDQPNVKHKMDSFSCKIGCSYFVRGPPSVYTGQGGKFHYANTPTKRFYPPGPTDYWVGLEAAAVADCKQACDNFACRHGSFWNMQGRFPTECPNADNPQTWWVTGACNLGCDLAAITRYNRPNRTTAVPTCAQKEFVPVPEDCRCGSGAPVYPLAYADNFLRSPLATLGWTPPMVDCEVGRFCYQDFGEDRVRCHVRKKIVYGWVRQFVSKEKCPSACGLEDWTLFGEVRCMGDDGSLAASVARCQHAPKPLAPRTTCPPTPKCVCNTTTVGAPPSRSSMVFVGDGAVLPKSSAQQLLTLRMIDVQRCQHRIVSRSYSGLPWEGVRPTPLQPECRANGDCILRVTTPGVYRVDVVTRDAPLGTDEAAVRFLLQSTFGASRADIRAFRAAHSLGKQSTIADTDTRVFQAWIDKQMALPPTLTRKYYRERTNPRLKVSSQAGNPIGRCGSGSRWMRFAFDVMDWHKTLRVVPSKQHKRFLFYVDGNLRTVQATWLDKPWAADAAEVSYTICGVHERVGARLELGHGSKFKKCPARWVIGKAEQGIVNAKNPPVNLLDVAQDAVVYPGGESILSQLYPHNRDVFLMTRPPPGCAKAFSKVRHSSKSFMQMKDPLDPKGGLAVFRYDPVLALMDNTLEHPANVPAQSLSAGGVCPSVARTFLNKDSCVRRPAGICSPPAFKSGVKVTLEPTVLRQWYTQSKRYLHVMKGLRLEDPYDVSPCVKNQRSRWRRTRGACAGGPTGLDTATKNTLASALKKAGEIDKNPYMRDIVASNSGGVCSTKAITIGAKVAVDGYCFEHVHPELLSVFDMTYWSVDHPGNVNAFAQNRRNPITAFADRGETDFMYPSHHNMKRWWDKRRPIAGEEPFHMVGRLGDTLDFASLETDLQTEEMAVALGASVDTATDGGVEACGSPGEVANIPSKGHHFYYLTEQALQNRELLEGDINYAYSTAAGKDTVWYNTVLNAPDQLRHRVAWALSQIIVVAEAGVALSAEDYEPWLNYFDIHVRHAFGNFRDVLKEVSFNPFMGVYLTYRRNKAFAYDKSYPDENYAREIMQLFSVGLWKLNLDGTQVLDDRGESVPTYSNDDVVDFAKVWTGFDRRSKRGNIESKHSSVTWASNNNVDPMQVKPEWRDYFPKTSLDSGYLGDGYPLCQELGRRPFLAQGATYKYTGQVPIEGPWDRDPVPGRPRLTPSRKTSALYRTLCARGAGVNGICTFPSEVILPKTLPCDGLECGAENIRMVTIIDRGEKFYYTYIPRPCVRLTWFEGGLQTRFKEYIKNVKGSSMSCYKQACNQCADPGSATAAGAACCNGKDDLVSLQGSECLFVMESMRFATAQKRCAMTYTDGRVCAGNQLNYGHWWKHLQRSCHHRQFDWTSTPCSLKVQVLPTGHVSLVSPSDSYAELQPNSGNVFRVRWHEGKFPSVQNGGCAATAGCAADSAGNCICSITVDTEAVYDHTTKSVPSVATLRKKLFIGALDPSVLGDGPAGTPANVYAVMSPGACRLNSKTNGGVKNVDFTQVSVSTVAQCKSLCDAKPACLAVEVRDEGYHCELWTKLPKFTSGTESTRKFSCHRKQKPATGDSKAGYERCTAKACTSTAGVNVYSRGDSASPFDMHTIFEIANAKGKGGRKARFLLNRASTVRLGATGFVSGPRKANGVAETACKRGGWTGTLAEAKAKCAADAKCGFVHDADCDGRGWRYCTGSADQQATGDALACIKVKGGSANARSYSFRNPPNFMPMAGETYYGFHGFNSAFREPQALYETEALLEHLFSHPNTAPFIAHRLIQRMTTSNPSPKYVKAVATAFSTGAYKGKVYSGQYGDLAATVAAILLEPEARSVMLDYDPTFGRLREPLLKVLHILRALEYKAFDQRVVVLRNMADRIGEGAFDSPTVFNFYLPEYQPHGPVGAANLYSPEAQLSTSPLIIGYLNGVMSLVDRGLTSSSGGFGETFLRHLKPSDGELSFTPTHGSDPVATVDELAVLLTGGKMSSSHRSTIAAAYGKFLGKRQRIPYEHMGCDHYKPEGNFALHSCAYCSRWFDGRSAYEETEKDGACLYAKFPGKTARCFPARWLRYQKDATILCTGGTAEEKRASALMAQKLALQQALKLFFMSSSFHSTNLDQSTGVIRRKSAPQVSRGRPFKALVVLFLHGGSDSFNMLVPHSECGAHDLYKDYAAVRGPGLAIKQAHLLPIKPRPDTQPCGVFGINPVMPHLQRLYNQGDAAMLANVGAMVEPITKQEFKEKAKRVPPSLFAHNTQQRVTASVHAQYGQAKGVVGRIAESLVRGKTTWPFKTALYSLAGNQKIMEGELAAEIVSAHKGVERFSQYDTLADDVGKMIQEESHSLFGESYSSQLESTLMDTEALGAMLDGAVLKAGNRNFPTDHLGRQFDKVSKLIKVGTEDLEMERAGVITSLGGFDTHNDEGEVYNSLMQRVDAVLGAFEKEMKAQGLWDSVSVLTISDFGRTLTSNGLGTDHAWGGNYFLVGGNVSGSQILGSYPQKLNDAESDVNIGRGRILPTTSWEGVWLGLAQWMGVPSSDIPRLLPNLENFHKSTLFNQSTLFDINMVEDIDPEKDTTTTTAAATTTTTTTKQDTTVTTTLKSKDKCPKTCTGQTCDHWVEEQSLQCTTIEEEYKCDCSGCACKIDKMLDACKDYKYKGDGNCDDGNNNAGCHFDGGDCCTKSLGGPVKKDYCKQCKCLDPNPKAPKAAACGQKEYKGDGNCDDDNNNKGCDFDGGDCCAKSVGGSVKKDYCKECKCLDPSPKAPKGPACGQEEYKGDGNCDDDNNNAGCDFDGGDCCAKSLGSPVKKDYCKECKCLDPNPKGSACGQEEYKGDGNCDDDNNNAGCAFDGGDCCTKSLGGPVKKDYCKQCKCLDPNPKAPKAAACGQKEYKGDGNCDDDNNNAGCDFDGGDCCAKSLGGAVKKDYCKTCKCLDPNPKGPACGQEEYKGDGNCDDDNNNKGCEYDGGDCCAKSLGSPVKKDYCKQCKCLDPNPKAPQAPACGQEEYKGDGNCDDDNNNAGCDFDGGDCCVKSLGSPVKKDYCKECKCLDPNPIGPACGQEEYKGDGNCDDDNNNKGCDFDGGDCCVKSLGGPVKKDYCKECKCLQ